MSVLKHSLGLLNKRQINMGAFKTFKSKNFIEIKSIFLKMI